MADLYPYLLEMHQSVGRVLGELPIHDDPLEVRFHSILKEKKAMLEKSLEELDNYEPRKEMVTKWLKIIYRDDETAKLNFHSWKRICLQDGTVNEDELEKMEDLLSHMKKTLNELAEHTSYFTTDEMRFIAPPLYRYHS